MATSQSALISGPDSRQLVFLLQCWLFGLNSGSSFGVSGDVLGLFAEEQDNDENEKRQKKKKGTKRKRDGRGQEEGAYDLKLDDMLDRTLEDGAKQHNLTAVNVRNILHVSKPGSAASCVIGMESFHGKQIKMLQKFLTPTM